MSVLNKILCIYHGNCQDGFAAAWAVRHALGADAVEFYPGVHQELPPDVRDRDVIMVDFAYKQPVIEAMAAVAKSIQIFDHHASAQADLAGYAPPGFNYPHIGPLTKVMAVFDMDRSGAGLAWDCFHPGRSRPPLINHIEDRDLWRFHLPNTRFISAALFSYPYDFDVWDTLMAESQLPELIRDGDAIDRKHRQDIANMLPVVQREMVIGGTRMPVANLPLTLVSDAGHIMAWDSDARVAACYWDSPEGRVFSLRSTDFGPDCSEIAVRYGGGGHVHAAGFRMPLGWEGDPP